MLTALVAAVAALGSVTPPRNAAEPQPPSLPGPPVVFGRQAGALAVGIAAAVRDGRLGVEATVLGQDGLAKNGLAVAVAAGDGGWTDAQPCGNGRYCAGAAVASDAPHVRLRVGSRVVAFALPARPRHALARRIASAAARATRELRTVVIRERLSADPRLVLHTTFTIRAPDAMTYRSAEQRGATLTPVASAVVLGATRWDRTKPGAPWVRSELQPLDQPVPDWRVAAKPSLLGAGTLRGERVWRVSFYDPTVPAWFEVEVDRRTARPLRVHMTAAAHFMVRDWGAFDDPVSIEPPASAR